MNAEVLGLFLGSLGRLYVKSLDVLCYVCVIVWMIQGGLSDFLWAHVNRFCVMVYVE